MSEGATTWLIPDAYIPDRSTGDLPSHEAICVLNTTNSDARLEFSFYFEDRDPIVGVTTVVPAERTRHIRTDDHAALGGVELPKGVPFAIRVRSDVPVTIQYSRLDSSQDALALMTTMGHPS
jgi:hypothetical protein